MNGGLTMSPIDSIARAATTGTPETNNPTGTSETKAPSGVLDKDGFLRLLVGQLRQQDPMNAPGTDELMAQMTQLSMLEQVTNLTAANEQLVLRMETSQALQLIGRTVSYLDDEGAETEGVVEKVEFEEGEASLTVGGQPGISPADVSEVR
jgi:flagellar basal-body rod modification protein FlgD